MKKWIVIIVLIGLHSRADEFRTFTAEDGRTLKAKILSVDGLSGKVQILREDNKKLTVTASAFSQKDQAYIASWQAAQDFLSPSKLKLELNRDEVKSSKKEHEADLSQIKLGKGDGKRDGVEVIATDNNTEYKFNLILENKGTTPLKNITMEYRIFYEQEKPVKDEEAEKRRKENDREDADERVRYTAVDENKVKDGTVRINALEPKESKEISTGSVTILKRTVDKAYQDKINLKGSLAGAWVKLTMKGPDGTRLVREIAQPESIMKKYQWDQEEVQE